MADRYAKLTRTRAGALAARTLRLPTPVQLERQQPGTPLINGAVTLCETPGGVLAQPAARALTDAAVTVTAGPAAGKVKAIILDASGIASSPQLAELQHHLHGGVAQLERCGRVIVLALDPADTATTRAHTAQRALEGFTRSLAKELGGRGVTVQLVHVATGAHDQLEGTLRFLLSPRSAFITGQVIRLTAPPADATDIDWERPLEGRVALITGAARGIGAAIAETLARDGAHIVGLDIPANAAPLQEITGRLGGEAIELDITAPEAPQLIAKRFNDGLDILIHNAGVTADRTLAKMPAERWQNLMAVNLTAQEDINEALLKRKLIGAHGRIISVSSMSGIAGNQGQTNYATSKAGVIGMVQALAPQLAASGATINAVAPGFIETQMTDRMPFAIREAGRRMSSLRQGGQPVDVAETISWLASPATGAVNANTIRVCGQNLLGA